VERIIKKRVLSGDQPTGGMHIGNYIGALSLWVENQDFYDNLFCIVDLHAITIPKAINSSKPRQYVKEVAAIYLACGIDSKKSTIFVQSHVPYHSELAWILNCITPMRWIE
jgi:tryptophanyl-tRNA synthetase